MKKILQKKFKLKDSVDIYKSRIDDCVDKLQFYKINTREKSSIKINREFSLILSQLNGLETLENLFVKNNFHVEECEIIDLFDYLMMNGYVVEVHDILKSEIWENEFSRQINYFDDLLSSCSGIESQRKLKNSNAVIIGCGSVGSSIAIQLIRAGVGNITLLDFKAITEANQQRHLFYTKDSIGKYKVKVLAEYLKKISPQCNVVEKNEKILPNTDLDKIIGESVDIIVNTADEPYIGHISVKIGRYLWPRKIAMYIAGGFDAHLTSSGEFVIPSVTPCIDCCSDTFKVALKDWKPTYMANGVIDSAVNIGKLTLGGAGGLASQSLLSASFASMNIINYLIKNKNYSEEISRRGEYIPNIGKMTWIKLEKQKDCNVCSVR